MARKVKPITIPHEGRDKGKVFIITEMSATQADDWASRAFFAIGKSGVSLPDHVFSSGLAGLAHIGFSALMRIEFDDAKVLFEELMACVKIQPDLANPAFNRPLVEDDIEEVGTRLFLKAEVFSLHTGFSIAGALSKLMMAPATKSEG